MTPYPGRATPRDFGCTSCVILVSIALAHFERWCWGNRPNTCSLDGGAGVVHSGRPVSKLYANLWRMTGYRAPGFQALAPSGQRSAGARPPRPTFAMAHPRMVPCRTAQSRAARAPRPGTVGSHARSPQRHSACKCTSDWVPPFFCLPQAESCTHPRIALGKGCSLTSTLHLAISLTRSLLRHSLTRSPTLATYRSATCFVAFRPAFPRSLWPVISTPKPRPGGPFFAALTLPLCWVCPPKKFRAAHPLRLRLLLLAIARRSSLIVQAKTWLSWPTPHPHLPVPVAHLPQTAASCLLSADRCSCRCFTEPELCGTLVSLRFLSSSPVGALHIPSATVALPTRCFSRLPRNPFPQLP